MIPDLQPVCQVDECKRGAQVFSLKTMNGNGKNQYLKTCVRHSVKDLPPFQPSKNA